MSEILSQPRYNKEDMNKAIEALREGGSVLFPTELDWVLGCDARNTVAVERLSTLTDYFNIELATLLIDNSSKLTSYIQDIPEMAWDLIEFSEKPLSIIFTGTKNLAEQLTGDTISIAFRVTSGYFARNLCTRFRNPIYSISIKNDPQLMHALVKLIDVDVNYENAEPVFINSHGMIQLDHGNLFKIVK